MPIKVQLSVSQSASHAAMACTQAHQIGIFVYLLTFSQPSTLTSTTKNSSKPLQYELCDMKSQYVWQNPPQKGIWVNLFPWALLYIVTPISDNTLVVELKLF